MANHRDTANLKARHIASSGLSLRFSQLQFRNRTLPQDLGHAGSCASKFWVRVRVRLGMR